MVRKPEGVNETEALLRKLVQVPKAELDKQLAKPKPKRKMLTSLATVLAQERRAKGQEPICVWRRGNWYLVFDKREIEPA